MIIFVLALISVVLFVVGISFLLKSYRDIPAASKLVSDQDYARVTQELKASRDDSQQLKQQLDTLAVQFDQTHQDLLQMKQQGKDFEDLKARESEHQEKIRRLQHDLDFLCSKADRQADRAVTVLQALDQEKKRIQDDLTALDQKMQAIPFEELKAEKETLRQQLEENRVKIQSLESERDQLKEFVDQQRDKTQDKREHHQKLMNGIKKLHQQIKRFETHFNDMLASKERQLRSAESQVKQLGTSLATLNDQLAENQEKIRELEAALATKSAVASPEALLSISASSSRAGEAADASDLKAELQRLQKENALLTEKESMLMFELTKSRAKVMSLEKICRDMRKQRSDQPERT